MASTRVPVEPAVLAWARKTIGLDMIAAARRVQVSPSVLEQWEGGDLQPTIKQLRRAAKAYKRPLAVLLLDDVPRDFQPLRDYRRQPVSPVAQASPELLAEVRRAQSQRDVTIELAEVVPNLIEPTQLPTATLDEDPEVVGGRLRAAVGVSSETQRGFPSPDVALRTWIQATEDLGVIVVQTSGVKREEIKGFSIGDRPHPVIAMNGSDWPRQRIFTLMHELAHVSLRAGGLCDLHEVRGRKLVLSGDDRVEHFCNAVAASVLMVKDHVLAIPVVLRADQSTEWDLEEIRVLARRFEVSSESLLLRLISLNRASWELYWTIKPELDSRYEEAWELRRARQRDQEGGPSYYTIKARDLGRRYVRNVLEAYSARAISSAAVSDYLDIKFNNISRLAEVIRK